MKYTVEFGTTQQGTTGTQDTFTELFSASSDGSTKNGTYELQVLSLDYDRAVYEPCRFSIELQVSASTQIDVSSDIAGMFRMKSVQVRRGDSEYLAKGYFVYGVNVCLNSSSQLSNQDARIYVVRLTVFSKDKLLDLKKHSKSFTARKLRNDILQQAASDCVFGDMRVNVAPLRTSSATKGDELQNIWYNKSGDDENYHVNEFIQPYVVQYNESYYDMLRRTSNRCGEFLYFEDGMLHLGLYKESDSALDSAPKQVLASGVEHPESFEQWAEAGFLADTGDSIFSYAAGMPDQKAQDDAKKTVDEYEQNKFKKLTDLKLDSSKMQGDNKDMDAEICDKVNSMLDDLAHNTTDVTGYAKAASDIAFYTKRQKTLSDDFERMYSSYGLCFVGSNHASAKAEDQKAEKIPSKSSDAFGSEVSYLSIEYSPDKDFSNEIDKSKDTYKAELKDYVRLQVAGAIDDKKLDLKEKKAVLDSCSKAIDKIEQEKFQSEQVSKDVDGNISKRATSRTELQTAQQDADTLDQAQRDLDQYKKDYEQMKQDPNHSSEELAELEATINALEQDEIPALKKKLEPYNPDNLSAKDLSDKLKQQIKDLNSEIDYLKVIKDLIMLKDDPSFDKYEKLNEDDYPDVKKAAGDWRQLSGDVAKAQTELDAFIKDGSAFNVKFAKDAADKADKDFHSSLASHWKDTKDQFNSATDSLKEAYKESDYKSKSEDDKSAWLNAIRNGVKFTSKAGEVLVILEQLQKISSDNNTQDQYTKLHDALQTLLDAYRTLQKADTTTPKFCYDFAGANDEYFASVEKDGFDSYNNEGSYSVWGEQKDKNSFGFVLCGILAKVMNSSSNLVETATDLMLTQSLQAIDASTSASSVNNMYNAHTFYKYLSDQKNDDDCFKAKTDKATHVEADIAEAVKDNIRSLFSTYADGMNFSYGKIGQSAQKILSGAFYSLVNRYERIAQNSKVILHANLTDASYTSPKLGQCIEVDGVKYIVTRVSGKASTTAEEQTIEAVALGSHDGSNIFIPGLSGHDAVRVSEPQSAIVADDADPQLLGRVRVRYHWQSDQDEASPWLRLQTPYASQGGGMFFLHHVGMEVMISYEQGNIERPFVSGAVYNSTVKPPYGVPSNPRNQTIQSVNGHRMYFTDLEDTAFLTSFINIPGVNGLLSPFVKDTSTDSVAGGVTLTDRLGFYKISCSTHNRSIDIASPLGTVSLSAMQGIKISAPHGDISIEGKNVSIKARNSISLESGTALKSLMDNKGIGSTIANAIGSSAGKIVANMIDLSVVRCLVERFLEPVSASTSIRAHRLLIMDVGRKAFDSDYIRTKDDLKKSGIKSPYKQQPVDDTTGGSAVKSFLAEAGKAFADAALGGTIGAALPETNMWDITNDKGMILVNGELHSSVEMMVKGEKKITYDPAPKFVRRDVTQDQGFSTDRFNNYAADRISASLWDRVTQGYQQLDEKSHTARITSDLNLLQDDNKSNEGDPKMPKNQKQFINDAEGVDGNGEMKLENSIPQISSDAFTSVRNSSKINQKFSQNEGSGEDEDLNTIVIDENKKKEKASKSLFGKKKDRKKRIENNMKSGSKSAQSNRKKHDALLENDDD